MGRSREGTAAGEALERLAPGGLALLLLALGLAIWEPFPPGIWHDDGVYVLLGRSLAQGEGLRYLGVLDGPLAPKFPPLFPLLLALVWILAPTFPENIPILAGVNLVILAGAGGLFAAYLRKILGLPLSVALAATVLAWISPELWRVGLVPLSEPLFLLSMVLALWAGGRMETESGAWPVLLFLLAGGMAFYVRTLGVAVLLAGVLTLFLRRRGRAAWWTLGGSVALTLPWLIWSSRAATTLPVPLKDTLGPYGGWWVGQVTHDPGAFGGFLLTNLSDMVSRVLSLLLPGVVGVPLWSGILLLPVLFFGLRELTRRSWVFPLALGLQIAVLLLWPFRDIRLLVPLQPLLVLATLQELASIKGMSPRLARERGKELLEGLMRVDAMDDDSLTAYPRGIRNGPGRPTPEEEALADKIRKLRSTRAEELGVERGVLLSNTQILEIVRRSPSSPEELEAVPGMRKWQAQLLETKLLGLLP
ncbi:HRDC domain-containing protein [Gemmatimonadota bacterium]